MRQPSLLVDEAPAERASRVLEVLARAAMAHANLVQRLVDRLEAGGHEAGHRGSEGCGCMGEARRNGYGRPILAALCGRIDAFVFALPNRALALVFDHPGFGSHLGLMSCRSLAAAFGREPAGAGVEGRGSGTAGRRCREPPPDPYDSGVSSSPSHRLITPQSAARHELGTIPTATEALSPSVGPNRSLGRQEAKP